MTRGIEHLGRLALASFVLAGTALAQAPPHIDGAGPDIFTYPELLELAESDEIDSRLHDKLRALTTTPFVSNEASVRGVSPHLPTLPFLGRSMRVVHWNVARGIELTKIIEAFTNADAFLEAVESEDDAHDAVVLDELHALQTADVLVLNEVDWGMRRSGYRHVARDLAEATGMNWAFGVEFVEVDPVSLGTETFEGIPDEEERRALRDEILVDETKLRALHGTAILSRFPIVEARLESFSAQGYDWFADERNAVSELERGKREAAERVFLEKVGREIRRGGRTALIVTLDVPQVGEGRVTIAAPHLENRAKPSVRRDQMAELLVLLRDVNHPVVIAGDLNTTFTDTQPTSIRREIYRRVGSSEFWANTGIKYATGLGLAYDAVRGGVSVVKNQLDPTVRHVPIIAPNPELGLFKLLERFRFRDGHAFDFRGDEDRTVNGTAGTLANSNARALKGFAPSYAVNRTVGTLGNLKLDWIFVKSYAGDGRDTSEPYRLAPHYPRTMRELNHATEPRLSDHDPISVDLPLDEPGQVETLRERRLLPDFLRWPGRSKGEPK